MTARTVQPVMASVKRKSLCMNIPHFLTLAGDKRFGNLLFAGRGDTYHAGYPWNVHVHFHKTNNGVFSIPYHRAGETVSSMAFDEIARLKQAERTALEIISRAEKEAEDILSRAAKDADACIAQALEDARREGDLERRSALERARNEGEEITMRAVSDSERIVMIARGRSDRAVWSVLHIVTGESYAVSGQDVQGDARHR